jgi:Fic family protein
MMRYNWQQKDWPHFTYKLMGAEDNLFSFAEKTGHITGIVKALPEETQLQAVIDMMVSEAIKTSEIEGEYLSRKDVLSSIRKNLGLTSSPEYIQDKRADGIGLLMIDVRNTYKDDLTKEKLFAWHSMLLPVSKGIEVGKWRTHEEPMQIISGAMGKHKVHYEAPPSAQVPREMDRFISWFNDTAPGGKSEIKKAPVRAAVAHLYFECIHPFEDGNGRIGRAIAEKALSQGIGRPVLLSLSRTIEASKQAYYDALKETQRSNEITPWVNYFVKTVLDAQIEAEAHINFTLQKVKYFDRFKDQLNERQLTVIRRMLEEGPGGFEGGMNARKYVSMTKASKATATRDLQELLAIGAFIAVGASRSTRYEINFDLISPVR